MIRRNPLVEDAAEVDNTRLSDAQNELWSAFVLAYCATTTRREVNRYLRALVGVPK